MTEAAGELKAAGIRTSERVQEKAAFPTGHQPGLDRTAKIRNTGLGQRGRRNLLPGRTGSATRPPGEPILESG